MSDASSVAEYYDRNTSWFLRFGRSRRSVAIHRELWGPGVRTPEEAGAYINGWIADAVVQLVEAGTLPPPRVFFDLGCGVGGTLFQLAERFPEAHLHGVTLSRRQVEWAEQLRASREGGARCHFLQGDFHRLDFGVGTASIEADVSVAIEAFVHARAPVAFLRTAAEHTRAGGRLFLVDDFLTRPRKSLSPTERQRVSEFEAGWRLGSLCTVDALCADASQNGWVPRQITDLTPLFRPGRLRDRLIARLSPWFQRAGWGRIPFFGNMIGGNALQIGLTEGFLRYQCIEFERHSPCAQASH
jgi:SAM-dependent methyltransferase